MMEALVPVNKAMEMTGLSRTTLWRLEKAGKIQATMRNGKKMLFMKQAKPTGERPRKKSI